MPQSLRIVISGASSGIGSALAREYAKGGATLGLIARRGNLLDQLASELRTPVMTYAIDVRNSEAQSLAASDFMQRFGCPDIVIANAGISFGTSLESSEDVAGTQGVMDTNVMGMLKTFLPFVSEMRKSKHGTLAGIASVAGFRGIPGAGAYSASKAAMIAYLESLRGELLHDGIKVLAICPGYIDTPMTQNNPFPMPFIISAEQAAKKIVRAIATRRGEVVIPWQMAILSMVYRRLPRQLFDRIMSNAPRKRPRTG